MSDPLCITCGKPAGELCPEIRRAKERLRLPLTAPQRCPACLWAALLKLLDDDEMRDDTSRKEEREK